MWVLRIELSSHIYVTNTLLTEWRLQSLCVFVAQNSLAVVNCTPQLRPMNVVQREMCEFFPGKYEQCLCTPERILTDQRNVSRQVLLRDTHVLSRITYKSYD